MQSILQEQIASLFFDCSETTLNVHFRQGDSDIRAQVNPFLQIDWRNDDLPAFPCILNSPSCSKPHVRWLTTIQTAGESSPFKRRAASDSTKRKANFPSQYRQLPCFWTSHVNFAREKVPLSFHSQIGLASPLNYGRISTLTPCPISQTDYHLLPTITNPSLVHNSFPSNRPPSRYKFDFTPLRALDLHPR